MVERGLSADAWTLADSAAHNANVQVRQVDGTDAAAFQAVISEAWGGQQAPQSNLLQALSHAGNTVLAADREDAMIGVAFGFLGWSGGVHLHSHMTAVSAGYQSRGVGYALKLWQRALCLDNEVDEMRWTFDPLIARNAYFNLVKLGGEAVAYLPNLYGAMDDEVNAGDRSDRFEVVWRLDSDRVAGALHSTNGPVRPMTAGESVAVPEDFDALRRRDPAESRRVRVASGAQFVKLFAAGLRPEWAENGYRFTHRAAERAFVQTSGGSRD